MNEDNKSYVYVHRLMKTNEVFYVGSGKSCRMYSRHGRSIPWNKIVKENDWFYSIIKSNMSKEEAANLEVALISIYKPRANIHNTTLEAKAFSPANIEFIRSRYVYSELSSTSLSYKSGNNQHGFKKRVEGDDAGCLSNGRHTVHIGNRNAMVSRVVWYLLKNEDPVGFVIDHIDGNSLNNNISNLRKISGSDNNKNVRLKSNNKTGYKGVNISNNNYCIATLAVNGIAEEKHFSIKKYGKDLALALAVEYRFRRINDLVKQGESYTERHIGTYVKLPALRNYSDDEIEHMFTDEIISTNTSGKSHVHYAAARGHFYWTVNIEGSKVNFSVSKFGDVAKLLAFEYVDRIKGLPAKSIDGYSLLETNKMLRDQTSVNNTSGFKGIQFHNRKSGLYITSQVGVKYKGYTKSFSCTELGLMVALYEALKWRLELNKQLRLE